MFKCSSFAASLLLSLGFSTYSYAQPPKTSTLR